MPTESNSPNPSRRSFLQNTGAAVAGGALAASIAAPTSVHAAGSETIKVGLIGCGGRGTGAATNALRADPNVQLTAMADAFRDRLDLSHKNLVNSFGSKVAVDEDKKFVGFDAYKQLMQSDVDVVLLCTPPHFRPAMLEAAVAADKHIFCEKPVAVDPAGVRKVLQTVQKAKEKNLNVVSGLCWRYDYGVRETMKRIQDGAIGDIVAIQENYLTGGLWHRGRKPEWSEMEYQMRNWLYFTWLSGDHIVEQHIHSLDKALWLNGDKPPVRAFGLGGRQVRSAEKWGHIYDHFAICYEWESGVKTFAYTRQMGQCHNDVDDFVLGTKGKATVLGTRRRPRISNADGDWHYQGERPSMYDVEHRELFAALRSGNTINNGEYMSNSTLLAIMGREACYTGQMITWDDLLNSELDLSPAKYEWGDVIQPSVAIPGSTKLKRQSNTA
ncbi:MAG TPA: oxidoreductase [Planctomycetaceae bacterium]|nr:oxidoreductase [Blastopirellula sp.]HAY78300.1 oxidoreductase [Planctomycetaceae bacterium]